MTPVASIGSGSASRRTPCLSAWAGLRERTERRGGRHPALLVHVEDGLIEAIHATYRHCPSSPWRCSGTRNGRRRRTPTPSSCSRRSVTPVASIGSGSASRRTPCLSAWAGLRERTERRGGRHPALLVHVEDGLIEAIHATYRHCPSSPWRCSGTRNGRRRRTPTPSSCSRRSVTPVASIGSGSASRRTPCLSAWAGHRDPGAGYGRHPAP